MPDLTSLKLNKFQTPLTRELLQEQPEMVVQWLEDAIFKHQFIKNLISSDRPFAKDAIRDKYGRAILDITNPYIIEDVDYFRQSVIGFERTGKYCLEKPSKNRNSPYQRFWIREIFRCWDGMIRPEDGAWVTGLEYFFLNYYRMEINYVQKGSRKLIRKTGCPRFHEAIHYRYNYKFNARENGKHAIELSKRGAHPYCEKVYTPDGIKSWADITIGSRLFGSNGNITLVVDIPFDGLSPVYKVSLRDGREVLCSDDHKWEIVFKNTDEPIIMTTKELITKYKSKKKKSWRCPSGTECNYFIKKNEGVEYDFHDVKIEPYTLGLLLGDGTFRGTNYKKCVHICGEESDIKHYQSKIPYRIYKVRNDLYSWAIEMDNEYLYTSGLWSMKSSDKFIPDDYKYNSREVRMSILQGLMDTDGYSTKRDRSVQFATSSSRLRDDILELARSLGYNCNFTKKKAGYKKNGVYIECHESYVLNIYGGKELFTLKRKQENVNESKILSRSHKTCIIDISLVGYDKCKCVTVDAENHQYLIGEYVRTMNSGKSHCIASDMSHNLILGENWESKENVSNCLVAADESYLNTKDDGTFKKLENELTFLRENTPFPRSLLTKSSGDMSWMMGWKDKEGNPHGSKNIVFGATVAQSSDKMRGKRGFMHFEEMGNFPNLLDTYAASRRNCEDGDFAFAMMNLLGTANNKDSNFEGAKTLLYEPDENNLYSVENLYDEPSKGKSRFGLFTPAFLNRLSCDNEDGITDVVKALIQIMNARYKAKNSSKPEVLLRVIAEDPIDPAEAMITVRRAYFPTAALQEQLTYLNTNPHILNESLKGTLVMESNGEVSFRPTKDEPLRSWNKSRTEKEGANIKGALEIFTPPQKSTRTGKIQQERYLIGVDPIDQEAAESASLFCAIVFDRMTNSIVAEYTGRHEISDDNYELVRLLCFYYNAKCLYENNIHGLYGYFKQFNCTYMLAEAPEYLKAMEKIHYTAKGVVQKGLRATKPINDHANDLIRNWLIEPYETMVEDDNGNERLLHRQYLNTIMSPALLEELIGYFPEANVDRIRALGMVLIYRESFKQEGHDLISVVDDVLDKGYLGNSSFFDKKTPKKRSREDMKLTIN